MKITALYVYPIKGLGGIRLTEADLGPQGIRHDRRFMLFDARGRAPDADPDTSEGLKKMQLDSYPRCALFSQEFSPCADSVIVRFRMPVQSRPGLSHGHVDGEDQEDLDATALTVPLDPSLARLSPVPIDLHGSPASAAYRMGEAYDEWLSARFGFPVVMVYIGDGRRAIKGTTLLPPEARLARQQLLQREASSGTGWFSTFASIVGLASQGPAADHGLPPTSWISFSDMAPVLVASEASLANVNGRLSEGNTMDVRKFRPNMVVDGAGEEAWAEDFWAELLVGGEKSRNGERHRLAMTGMCARCSSINVNYATGQMAEGEMGSVFKMLAKDRRVDKGSKWNPIFGRYASLVGETEAVVRVGDEVAVVGRLSERTVNDW